MAKNKEKLEDFVFRLSILGALFYALVGIGWGVAIGSNIILFDGLYSILGVTLTSLALYVNTLARKPEDKRFPFGRQQLIPFALSMRSGVLLFLCLYAGISALLNMLSGGHEVNAKSATLYATLSTSGCLIVWLLLRGVQRKSGSEMVKVESHQWLLDTMLSAAVLIGFLIDLAIQPTRWAWLSLYIDSGMVLLACMVFAPMPLVQMLKGVGELLMIGLSHEMRERVDETVRDVLKAYDVKTYVLRATKGGDMVTVELDIVLPREYEIGTVEKLDEVREKIEQSLGFLTGTLWLSVTFTGDEKWV
ncbi:cation transporter [Planctomycetota bacterium]|nr:cation transporter [Planctomycetota bacterium]